MADRIEDDPLGQARVRVLVARRRIADAARAAPERAASFGPLEALEASGDFTPSIHVAFIGDQPYVDLARDLLGQHPGVPVLDPPVEARGDATGTATIDAVVDRLKQSLGGADPMWGGGRRFGVVSILLALGRRDEAKAIILSTGEPASGRAADTLASLWTRFGDPQRALQYIDAAAGPLSRAEPVNNTVIWEPSALLSISFMR
jgi:hypothetical protein